jgi:hypothetical protein
MLSLSLTNEDNLEETYNLQMCIEEARQNMERYDMTDVFTIIQVDGNECTRRLWQPLGHVRTNLSRQSWQEQ